MQSLFRIRRRVTNAHDRHEPDTERLMRLGRRSSCAFTRSATSRRIQAKTTWRAPPLDPSRR